MTQPVAMIAGATGFVGKALVAELVRLGVDTLAHVRPDSPSLARWTQHFQRLGARVDTTPWDQSALEATLTAQRVTVVFCCVGTTQRRMARDGRQANSYDSVDYELPKMLAGAAAQCPDAVRFVYLSSLGAGPRARGDYLKTRWRTEEAVRSSGVTWTIARPSFIVGEREEPRPLETVAAAITAAALQAANFFGARQLYQRYRPTDDANLARALARLGLDPRMAGHVVESEDLHEP